MNVSLEQLPGADLIREGLADLHQHRETAAGYLVQIASPRLLRSGIEVEVSDDDALNADHRLYALLGRQHGNEAHSRYNALLRELVSFERALDHRLGR